MMAGNPTTDTRIHRPGVVSAFFVYQSGLYAGGFWAWLVVLAVRGGPVTGWHILATAGAVSATLVTALLGARLAQDRAAADRYEALMRAVVELSWETFTSAARDHVSGSGEADSRTAEIIPLPHENRPRQRP
ncbi:MAG: hypothetical protein ACM3JP_01235 [Betaproteobacteria bacterium]